jgi:hypothetical protein
MPRSGAEVASAELIGGTDLGGRRGGDSESMPFSSLTSPSLPISLCCPALARVGGAHEARAGVRGT